MRQVMIAPRYEVQISDFEDGVFELLRLSDEMYEILETIKSKQKAFLIRKFKQGATISKMLEISEYGDSSIERISQATGFGTSTLYDARRFYESPKFGQSLVQLEAWFEEQQLSEKSVTWGRVLNTLKKEHDPSPDAVDAEMDRKAKQLEKKAQQLEYETEAFQEEVKQFNGSEHVKSQALGVATKAVQVAREKRDQVALMDTKPERITNNDYLDFIRSQPCCVTGMTEGVHPHHFLTGGMGTKGSDFATVPLYHELHRHLHDHGQDGFQEEYDVNFKEEMARLMHLYFVGVPPWKSKSVDKRAA